MKSFSFRIKENISNTLNQNILYKNLPIKRLPIPIFFSCKFFNVQSKF